MRPEIDATQCLHVMYFKCKKEATLKNRKMINSATLIL